MSRQNEFYPESIPHPGQTLVEKLAEMAMGPKEFAIRTGKPEKTVTAVLKGDSSITPDMAVQFENVTRIPAGFWLNHQKLFDEFAARRRQRQVIEEARDWTRMFPVDAMERLGWIPSRTTIEEQASELLAFFGFANHKAWEAYYLKQQLKVAFRISLGPLNRPHAISAWLRMGELQAGRCQVKVYSKKAFTAKLPEIRAIMPDQDHAESTFQRVQNLCAEAGVKMILTPCLPDAPIHGSARWVHRHPLIQLSESTLRSGTFWFTFFHEAGHLLKHGKKEIFLEDVEYGGRDEVKEKEADAFAEAWMRWDDALQGRKVRRATRRPVDI